MNYYLSRIGYQGPNTLLLLILIMLATTSQAKNIYLYIYVIAWQITSHFFNIVIKNTLKHPRPDSDLNDNFKNLTPTIDNYFSIHKNFGMPSGHAQMTGYAITFLYLVVRNPCLLVVSVFIGALTVFQRYAYRRHTATQLFAGLTVGAITAYILYEHTKTRLETQLIL